MLVWRQPRSRALEGIIGIAGLILRNIRENQTEHLHKNTKAKLADFGNLDDMDFLYKMLTTL